MFRLPVLLQTNSWRSLHFADVTREDNAMKRKRINTSRRGKWTVGPTSRVSLRDIPEENLADESNIPRFLVVVLSSLHTACMENWKTWSGGLCGNTLCVSHLKVLFYHIREFLELIPRSERAFKCEESADSFLDSPMPFT